MVKLAALDPAYWNDDYEYNDIRCPKEGGYIGRITGVVENKQYDALQIQLDISEGPCSGYFEQKWKDSGNWTLKVNWYNKDDDYTIKKIHRDISAIESSNRGYSFKQNNLNPETLIGLSVGVVITYTRWDFNKRERVSTKYPCLQEILPISQIRNKEFEVNKIQNETKSESLGYEKILDDDITF